MWTAAAGRSRAAGRLRRRPHLGRNRSGVGDGSMSVLLSNTDLETLTPIERLEALCDPGSLDVIRSEVTSGHMGLKARAGDGVVGGSGLVDGRPVFCYAQDNSYVGGSLGEMHAETNMRVMELADRARAPVVGFVGS